MDEPKQTVLGSMECRLGKIETRLDSIDQNLELHMKRSDMLEERQDQFAAAMLPMIELRSEIKGIIKAIKVIGILAGIAEVIHLYFF